MQEKITICGLGLNSVRYVSRANVLEITYREMTDPGWHFFHAKKGWLFGRFRNVTNLSETVPFDTLDASETRPSMSWDGERLVYGSGGVWLSEREY